MLMRSDPFREIDEFTRQMINGAGAGRQSMLMPLDAYRSGDEFVIHLDLPGIDPDNIDVTVERNTLTITAERPSSVRAIEGVEIVANERRAGSFSRQLFLGESLDTDAIHADYDTGVLTLRIPVAAAAKPRKVEVGKGGSQTKTIEAGVA